MKAWFSNLAKKKKKPAKKSSPKADQQDSGNLLQQSPDPPLSSPPSKYHVSAFEGASNFTISGGTFNIAGGDIHNHYHGPSANEIFVKTLNWITCVNFRLVQKDIQAKRTPGTGDWLLKSEAFQEWLRTLNGQAWGVGGPGVGKTFLACGVIDHLEGLAKSQPGISVTYAYCRFKENTPVRDILASLVRQLLERNPALVSRVESLYNQHVREGTQLSTAEILDILKDLLKTFDVNFIVLDGLDESPIDYQLEIVEAFGSFEANLFITSRPLETLKAEIPKAIIFEIEARRQDIELLVTQRINKTPALRTLLQKHDVKEEIISMICDKAQGMFLHAALQVEMLRGCTNLRSVREKIAAAPSKLDDLYIHTFQRIVLQPQEYVDLAIQTLIFLLYATRPLSLSDLQYAIATTADNRPFDATAIVDQELITSVCCGLVTVDVESSTIRLIHFTAVDSLPPLVERRCPNPHDVIAETCIWRILACGLNDSHFETRQAFEDFLGVHPFLIYANDGLGFHYKRKMRFDSLELAMEEFISQCRSYPIWRSDRKIGLAVVYLTPLHAIARFNDHSRLDDFLSKHGIAGINAPVDRGWTPLLLAASVGATEVVRGLLQVDGIQVNTTLTNDSTSALSLASTNGYEDIVQLLLDFDQTHVDHRVDGLSPVMIAARAGSVAVLKRVLDHNPSTLNERSDGGRTPLMWASSHDEDDAVEFLLSYRPPHSAPGAGTVDVNAVNNDGLTALMFACRRGYLRPTQRLMRVPHIDINTVDKYGRTALMLAAWEGFDTVVEQLLKHPAVDVNVTDAESGSTALIWAAWLGHEGVAKLLLGHPGIQVDVVGELGSALDLARSEGHDGIAQRILKFQNAG